MQKFNFLFSVLAVTSIMICTSSAKAQTNPNHVYHIQTSYMASDFDSAARAETAAMLKEYSTKVTMKNEFVIHQWNMVHFYTADSREFIVITEFANWNDIIKSGDRNTELERQVWPDAKKRGDFMKKMNSHFTHHKDAIYNGLANLTK